MQITLYNVPEDFRHISKTLGTGSTFGGTDQSPRGALDHVAPSILISSQITGSFNYAYIDTYGSYYWIKEISNERQNLTRIDLVRDPLTTFAAGVRACSCIAQRTANAGKFTTYIPDRFLRKNAYTINQVIAGADILSFNGKFILLTTG